jgi:hypothetical protein
LLDARVASRQPSGNRWRTIDDLIASAALGLINRGIGHDERAGQGLCVRHHGDADTASDRKDQAVHLDALL